ncbi:MAG TPA: metallophosphatase [Candidatus Wallbacteria bacterium]|nr:metallophosphatase [Candidatus Wallbacteria bacterium]
MAKYKPALKKSLLAFALVFAVLFVTASVFARTDISAITLIHTNDTHGNLQNAWENGSVPAEVIRKMKKEADSKSAGNYTLMLDAGDITSYKTPSFANVEKDIFLMGSLGYDAMALGNHEIDFGLDEFVELSRKVAFPVLCANLIRKDSGKYAFSPSLIKDFGGVRIAIIGLTHKIIMENMKEEDRAKVNYLETEEAYKKAYSEVKDKSDIIVLLSHLGVEGDRELAKTHPEIKLIVGAHSHTLIDKPEMAGKTCIVQAGRFCENIGKLDVKITGREIKSIEGGVINIRPPKQ